MRLQIREHQLLIWGEPINLSTQRMEVGRSMGQFNGTQSVGVSENGLWLIENAKTGEIEEFYRQYAV